MSEVYSYLKPVKSPLVKKELLRSALLYLLLVLLLALVAYMALLAKGYRDQAVQQAGEPTRTEEEFIAGGKRFLDYFMSVNSATVELDHYRAITMMVNDTQRRERREYLLKNDVIRRVKDSQMMSKIDWSRSRYEIQTVTDTSARIEYIVSIILDRRTQKTSHIVLDLVAVEKSDDFPDGIGIESWVDVASEPFKEESQ